MTRAGSIELIDVCKSFVHRGERTEVLKKISLQVDPSSIFGIIGESGAGKSTLVRCINMLEKPDSGKVLVSGHNLSSMSLGHLREHRRKIGMIFQNFNLLANSTIFENVALPLEMARTSKAEVRTRVNTLLQLVGLQGRAHHYPRQLSGGQKQRVSIARALVSDPEILLCDEATSALDPSTAESILSLLMKINERTGLTICLITHQPEVLKRICNQVALVDQGSVVERTSVEEFFSNPKCDLAKRYVNSIFKLTLPKAYSEKLKPRPAAGDVALYQVYSRYEIGKADGCFAPLARFNASFDIIQASIDCIRGVSIGSALIAVRSSALDLGQIHDYVLTQKPNLNWELLGYVA